MYNPRARVEKRKIVAGMKDLRPVALTSCVMNFRKGIVYSHTCRKSIVLYSGVGGITLTYMLVRQKRWLLTFSGRSAGLNLHRLFSGGNTVERFENYKYLGVLFDSALSWMQNTNAVLKKAQTRLFCLRKLKSFDVKKDLLQLFYSSVLSSVLTFGLLACGGNACKRDKEKCWTR